MLKEAEGKGEVPVLVTRKDWARLDARKRTQFEPFWLVIHRLLDQDDLLRQQPSMRPSPGRSLEARP